jgi:hypothetical protein
MRCLGRGRAQEEGQGAALARPSSSGESPPAPHPAISAPRSSDTKTTFSCAHAHDAAVACWRAESGYKLEENSEKEPVAAGSAQASASLARVRWWRGESPLCAPAAPCCRSLRPLLCRTATVLLLSGAAIPASAAYPGMRSRPQKMRALHAPSASSLCAHPCIKLGEQRRGPGSRAEGGAPGGRGHVTHSSLRRCRELCSVEFFALARSCFAS